ncbi:hypothetical protein FB446DRAFT_653639 [Lentinula raphanica]|nr:hypothetical protein FB446DRAFT_653639 [Lentinula raphanica]
MDFKAARPFGGFLDVTSHHTCFLCKCWHRAHLGRTDYESWTVADAGFLKTGAEAWLKADTSKDREVIENFYGTRYSELWRLPYWDPTKQLLVDPMHTIFLILMQRNRTGSQSLSRRPQPPSVLRMVQKSVTETTVPSWIARPPSDVGHQKAGVLKADHWRVLFGIHLPLSLVTLWGEGSPFVTEDAAKMASVLETSMHLSCASILMSRNSLSPETRDLFRSSLRGHILGLKENFPGFMLPSHHLAFHIFDFMETFSTVRNWWGFPFENLIGRLQRITTNHKTGTHCLHLL